MQIPSNTLLHEAARTNNAKLATELCKMGADQRITNERNQTAYDIAVISSDDDSEIQKILRPGQTQLDEINKHIGQRISELEDGIKKPFSVGKDTKQKKLGMLRAVQSGIKAETNRRDLESYINEKIGIFKSNNVYTGETKETLEDIVPLANEYNRLQLDVAIGQKYSPGYSSFSQRR